jgi:hypothetical protein
MEPDEQPLYSEDGVDLTLIRWMLRMTPAERLQLLEEFLNDAQRVLELNGRHSV